MSPKDLKRHIGSGFSLIELLIVVAIIGIIAAIALPNLQRNLKNGRMTAAVKSLQTIYQSQASFNTTKNKYGTLAELTEAGYLSDKSYASGKAVSGYVYSDTDVTADTFCAHANRESNGSGDRDYNVIEDGVVRYIESKTKGSVAHGEGTPISATAGGEAEKPDDAQKK